MVEWITTTMNALGYWGIGLLMFLENLFLPIPSELIMPSAEFTVATGNMNFQYAVLAGVLGAVLEALPWYYAGKLVGEARLKSFADRVGKWVGISGADLDNANRWFDCHGNKAVLSGRLVPGVRMLISLPAGISERRLAPFLVYSTIDTGIWVTILIYAGYLLGEHYDRVDDYLAPVSKIVLGGLIVALIIWVEQRKQTQRVK